MGVLLTYINSSAVSPIYTGAASSVSGSMAVAGLAGLFAILFA